MGCPAEKQPHPFTRAPGAPVHFPGVDGPAFVAPGMALGSAAAWPLQQLRCGASPHPPSPLSLLSAPPAEKAEWSVPSEPVTVTAAVTAAEERARRGGGDGRTEGGSIPACHCGAAAAAARKPLRENTSPLVVAHIPQRRDHRRS